MKPEDLKNSMNSIEPDSYMETRLFAEIKDAEKPKKKSGKLFKVAVCTALCCAVLVAGVGIGIPKKAISDKQLPFPILSLKNDLVQTDWNCIARLKMGISV